MTTPLDGAVPAVQLVADVVINIQARGPDARSEMIEVIATNIDYAVLREATVVARSYRDRDREMFPIIAAAELLGDTLNIKTKAKETEGA